MPTPNRDTRTPATAQVQNIPPAAGGAGLSTIQFSIGWSGSDADFKLTDPGPGSVQAFNLAAVLAGIEGFLIGVTIDNVEAFVNAGASNFGFLLDPDAATPAGEMFNYDPSTGWSEVSDLDSGVFKRAFLATGFFVTNIGRTFLGAPIAPTYDPQVRFITDGGAGPALSGCTAGKVIITLHYQAAA